MVGLWKKLKKGTLAKVAETVSPVQLRETGVLEAVTPNAEAVDTTAGNFPDNTRCLAKNYLCKVFFYQ
jgi:hypothetical protein